MSVASTARTRFAQRILPPPGPVRTLALALLINCLGSGMFLPISALYYTRIAGLSVAQVGIGLGIASVCGFASGVPIGHLADRRGPRELQALLITAMGICAFGYLWLTAFWQFLLLTVISRLLDRGVAAVGGALIAGATQGTDRVRTRAYLRVVLNFGMALGSGLAALALQAATPSAYRVVIVLNVISYLATAAVYLRLPRVPPVPKHNAAPPWQVVRDGRYISVTLLCGVLEMHTAILTLALPLWIAGHTSVPHGLISVILILNMAGCVLFQIPASRRTETVGAAARAVRIAGFGLLGACVLFAFAQGADVLFAVVLLLAGALLQLGAELLVSSAQFCLAFQLAQEGAQGQYQGMFSTGISLSAALAPVTMAVLPLGLGQAGWVLLGVIFVTAGLALGWLARWR